MRVSDSIVVDLFFSLIFHRDNKLPNDVMPEGILQKFYPQFRPATIGSRMNNLPIASEIREICIFLFSL